MNPLERLLLELIPVGRSGRGDPPPPRPASRPGRKPREFPPDPLAAVHRAELAAALAEHDQAAEVTDLDAYRKETA